MKCLIAKAEKNCEAWPSSLLERDRGWGRRNIRHVCCLSKRKD